VHDYDDYRVAFSQTPDLSNGPTFCFAGVWRPMLAGDAALTLLTTDPSEDLARS
jgi:hypothetical protein